MNGWPLIDWALNFAFVAVGPEVTDRVLALDTMYINVVALVILFGMRFGTELFFEAALIIALLGFASTVALARYLSRGDVME
jgi:multicomponent K+:H+ antiporter subunit F